MADQRKHTAGTAIRRIHLEGVVDLHFHFRNPAEAGDGRTEMLMEAVAHEHEAVVAIGNSAPPVTNQEEADAYHGMLCRHRPAESDLIILVAPLMTDRTTAEMVRKTRTSRPRTVGFWKAFFEGVSNDGGMSISDPALVHDAIRASYDDSADAEPVSVHFHAERKYVRGHTGETEHRIPMLEREWYCVDLDVREILEQHPDGIFVLKHITDWRTVEFVREYHRKGYRIYGEIAAQYLAQCFDDLWEGPGNKGTAFRANDVRWPLPKDRKSQLAIIDAALSGEECFLFGSDCAWHLDDPTKESGVKVTCDYVVCGGLAILPAVSLSIIIDCFVRAEKTEEDLNEFLSRRARRLLNLPPSQRRTRYERKNWEIPSLKEGVRGSKKIRVRLFMGGEKCAWRRSISLPA